MKLKLFVIEMWQLVENKIIWRVNDEKYYQKDKI